MTGPEHYREAERDIEIANDSSINDGTADFFLARAQVHATLALAAATAQASLNTRQTREWQQAASL